MTKRGKPSLGSIVKKNFDGAAKLAARQRISKLQSTQVTLDRQRRGIVELVGDISDPLAHVAALEDIEFPLGLSKTNETCLPHDLLACINIRKKLSDEDVKNYREERCKFWEEVALRKYPMNLSNDNFVNKEDFSFSVNPVLARFNCDLLHDMAVACNYPTPDLAFAYREGIHVVGVVNDGHLVFPPKVIDRQNDSSFYVPVQDSLIGSFPQKEYDTIVYEETLKELTQPWQSLVGPYSSRELEERLGKNWTASPRFAINQNGEYRMIDNLKASLINENTFTVNKLVTGGLEETCLVAALLKEVTGCEIVGGKRDHKKAYKQLGVKVEHLRYNIIAIPHNVTREVLFFVSLVGVFGHASLPVIYNSFVEMLVAILRREFLVPIGHFYDDFLQVDTKDCIESGLRCTDLIHFLVNVILKREKDQCGPRINYLGFLLDLHNMRISITADRIAKILKMIKEALRISNLHSSLAAKLAGRLNHLASNIYGKQCRPYLKAVYEQEAISDSVVGDRLRRCLIWWTEFISHGASAHRKIDLGSLRVREFFSIYTDAEESDTESLRGYGLLIFPPGSRKAPWLRAKFPADLLERLNIETKTKNIFVFELLGLVLGSIILRLIFGKSDTRNILIFCDNNAAVFAMVKGYCNRSDISKIIEFFWLATTEQVFIDRVKSKANPADAPSRDSLPAEQIKGNEIPQEIFLNAIEILVEQVKLLNF